VTGEVTLWVWGVEGRELLAKRATADGSMFMVGCGFMFWMATRQNNESRGWDLD
jgi:hypothetical protein